MNILFFLFVTTAIFIILYIDKIEMYFAKRAYIFTLFVIILLFSFISDSVIVKYFTNTFMPIYVYQNIHSALDNTEYVYSFLIIIVISTAMQLFSLLFILDNFKIRHYIKIHKKDEDFYKQNSIVFTDNNSKQENSLLLNKVYLGLCKMIN